MTVEAESGTPATVQSALVQLALSHNAAAARSGSRSLGNTDFSQIGWRPGADSSAAASRKAGFRIATAALSWERFLANVSLLDHAMARLRPHNGAAQTIEQLRRLLDDGALLLGTHEPRNLEDPLCFRNVSHFQASARHAFAHTIGRCLGPADKSRGGRQSDPRANVRLCALPPGSRCGRASEGAPDPNGGD